MLCFRTTRLRVFSPNQERERSRDDIHDPDEKQHSWRIDGDDSEQHYNYEHVKEGHSAIQVNVLG